jgi:hypothetical protein
MSYNYCYAQFNIDAGSTNYTQNFNTLTSGTWTDNSTLTGWYTRTTATSSITSYGANTGSTTTAGLYAYGVAGINPLSDRALGFATSNAFTGTAGSGLNYMGWRLRNNTGSEIIAITVTYSGEQWRREGNTDVHTLNVDYQISTTAADIASGTWTNISSLSFASPQTGASALTLDGNASANRVATISFTITGISIASGSEIMIRWTDLNDSGNDHHLAVDDVTVNAEVAATPGPSTLIAGATAEPLSFSSLINTQGASVHNFDITIQDDGSTPSTDTDPMQISQLRFRQGTGNDITDWTQAIQGAELSDGTNTQTGTISATNITFASMPTASGQLGHIADNASKTYTLKVWLKTDVGSLKTSLDGSNLVFRVINADVTITGSQLVTSQDINSGSTNNTIAVTATVLAFAQNTTNTDINNIMSPALALSANDANGNRDLDFASNISITSTGTLNSTPQTVAAIAGLATFSIVHTATGTTLTLTASSSGFTNITSASFNINAVTNATKRNYTGASGGAWLTAGNWSSSTVPISTTVAAFAGSQTTLGINMNGTTNNGTNNQIAGAIELESAKTGDLIIGNSSTTANGTLTLSGVAVNSISNIVIRNNSSQVLTIQDISGSGDKTMGLALANATNNIIQIDGSGGITISSIISGSNPVTKQGSGSGILQLTGANTYIGLTTVSAGTLQLNRTGGTTIPTTNNVSITGGTLRVSTNQTLNNLTLSSGTLTLDAGVTLTINGTLTIEGGSIGGSGSLAYGGSGTLVYGSGGTRTIDKEWPASSGPANITIQGSTSVTLNGNRTVTTLTLSSGSILSIASNTLTINGAVSGSGTLSGSSTSDLTIGGTAGTIAFTSGARTVRNLTIGSGSNSSMSLGSALDIAPLGSITFNASGTKSLTTNGNTLTLKSNATGTAYIGNTNSATITGSITVERFISSVARRWRFLATPFSNTTFDDWKQEIFITGAGGSTNGFDATLSNQPSVFWYNESTVGNINQGWVALTNSTSSLTNQPIIAGRGYRLFIRGDRSDLGRLTGTVTSQNEVTLNLTGSMHTGNFSMPVSFTSSGDINADGWCLVGNPYPCPYDWNAFYDAGANRTNIDPRIWVLDGTNNNYLTYDASENLGGLTGGIIPSGASFWVKTTGASPSLTFTEQHKVANNNPVSMFKTVASDELFVRFRRDSITSDIWILAHRNASTTNRDSMDTPKLLGEVSISSSGVDSVLLGVDVRPLISQNDTVNLSTSAGNQSYQFMVEQVPITNGKSYYLRDKKFNSLVTLSQGLTIPIVTVASDNTSYGNRFQIIVSSNASLPVEYLFFDALKQGETVLLKWATATEKNNESFSIEHSTDMNNWQVLGVIRGTNSNQKTTYFYNHITPNNGTNYYRIKQTDINSIFSYSAIRVVLFDSNNTHAPTISPNPAKDAILCSSSVSLKHIIITDVNGKVYIQSSVPNIDISALQSGVYLVKIIDENQRTTVQKLVKQ